MVDTYDEPVAQLVDYVGSRYFGKYRGIVESVEDDENLGRITCKVPSIYGDEVSPHALPALPFAGPNHGFVFLPKQGDGVWIEFEGGDISHPIWTGFWFAKNEIPSEAKAESRVLITSGGLKLIMDDDAKELKLLHGTKGEITMSQKGITLKFGSNKIELTDVGIALNGTAFKVV
jgi:hypothetical protein